MITRRALLRVVAVAAFGSPAAIRESSAAGAEEPENLASLLVPIRSRHGMPALAAGYVQGADLKAIGAVGSRRGGVNDPVDTTDRFHLGSCTKSMTATLMARLVEQGKLDWSVTIADVFPSLRDEIHPKLRAVTPVHLLSHRAGLPEDRSPGAIWSRVRPPSGSLPEQRRTLAALGLKAAPVSAPGSRFEYSNFGYMVAGAMVEEVTGQEWEDLMRRLVFEPLGMATAGFGAPGRGQPWGHTDNGCEPVSYLGNADNPAVIGPAGAVHCALADWAAYASLHLLGAQGRSGLLLASTSFAQLHRDHFNQGYALGWGLVDRSWAGGRALTHAGTNRRWYAMIWIAPTRDAALVAASNCAGEEGFRACDAAISAMIKKFL